MTNDEIFDSANYANVQGWEKLPNVLKYFFTSQQKSIMDRVKREVIKKYGEDKLEDLVKTSGWRSIGGNHLVGGVADSLHLYGCAVDFQKKGIFSNNPIPVCCDLQCLESKNCWHVQFRRK